MGDTRKPLIWKDYEFETEKVHPLGLEMPESEVKFNQDLFDYYQKLIQTRKEHKVLRRGEIDYILEDDANNVLAYRRFDAENEVLAVFNASREEKTVKVPVKTAKTYRNVLSEVAVGAVTDGQIEITLPARQAVILVGQ